MDQYSSVGKAIGYDLDSPGIEYRWGEIFLTVQTGLGAYRSLLYNEHRIFFLGVKLSPHGVKHPPSSRAIFKERVQLYICFPSGPSQPILGRSCTFIVACIENKKCTNKSSVRKPNGKRPFGKPRRRQNNNVPCTIRFKSCITFTR